MNHQPFEDLLFREEPLLPQELDQLKQHLADCESCSQLSRAWKDVQWQLDHPMIAAPAEGFVTRWKTRLEVERKRSNQRQNFIFLVLSVFAVVLLSIGFLAFSLPVLRSPELLFWTYLERILSLALIIDILKDFATSFYIAFGQQLSGNSTLITFIPVGMILLVGVVFELIVLWFVSLRLLTRPRRVPL